MGDFVGIDGAMWTTDKGEHTVGVTGLTVLNKAVRPMPDKWAGVHDTDLRYRKRYLDLLSNAESRERFRGVAEGCAPSSAESSERGSMLDSYPILGVVSWEVSIVLRCRRKE